MACEHLLIGPRLEELESRRQLEIRNGFAVRYVIKTSTMKHVHDKIHPCGCRRWPVKGEAKAEAIRKSFTVSSVKNTHTHTQRWIKGMLSG
jgi:hypothetical protein